MFLLLSDYKAIIKTNILQCIIDDDDDIRTANEAVAIEQVKSVLAARHNLDCIFPTILPYIPTVTYAIGQNVLHNDLLYITVAAATGQAPPPVYDETVVYAIGNKALWNQSTYSKTTAAAAGTHPTDTANWEVVAEPTWKLSTARNPLIISTLMDLTLYHIHSRISPNNIPQIRIDRYEAAQEWLHEVSMGRAYLADCLLDTDEDGNTDGGLTWGSSSRKTYHW